MLHHDDEKSTDAPIYIEHVQNELERLPTEEEFVWSLNVILNLVALIATGVCGAWGILGLSINLFYIEQAFPTETAYASWIAAVFSLAQVPIALFVGELSDFFGRRWFIVSGNALLVLGNIIASRGTSVNMIIGGQTISGIGTSFAALSTPALAEIVPKKSRGLILGIGICVITTFAAFGPLGLGAFVKFNVGGVHQSWRIGGYIGAGFGAVGLILSTIFYHPGRRQVVEGMTTMKRLRMLDWFGMLVGTAAMVLTLLGLDFGGNPYAWSSSKVLGLLIVGIVCLVIFAVWEVKFVSFGLIPGALFEHRNYGIVLASQFVEGMAINTGAAFLTQIQLYLFTTDPLEAQVRVLANSGAGLVVAAVVAIVVWKTKETKWALIACLVLAMLGPGVMSLVRPNSHYYVSMFGMLLIGASVGGLGVGVNTIATLCTPNQLIATAVSLLSSARGLGGAVGIVIFSQVLESKLKKGLPSDVEVAVVRAGLPLTSVEALLEAVFGPDPASVEKVPGVTPAVLAAVSAGTKTAYAEGFSYMWYALIPFVFVSFVLALFLKPTKPITTGEVANAVRPWHENAHAHDEEKHVDVETTEGTNSLGRGQD